MQKEIVLHSMQNTAHIFMIRPVSFSFNHETASSNAFQSRNNDSEGIEKRAVEEFDNAVKLLREAGVDVKVFDDTSVPTKPDAIFPNNWISLHADGTMVLYPMAAANRRNERREDIINYFKDNYNVLKVIDLTHHEEAHRFLEGTGSIVFDHQNRCAYACISVRTNAEVLVELCNQIAYTSSIFHSYNHEGQAVYHTNVMMCIGEKFVVICAESIPDVRERNRVLSELKSSGRSIIELSFEQMGRFAGNMLSLKSQRGEELLVMSHTAFESLTEEQKNELGQYARIIALPISTIETTGGGSARCMIAEVFSQAK